MFYFIVLLAKNQNLICKFSDRMERNMFRFRYIESCLFSYTFPSVQIHNTFNTYRCEPFKILLTSVYMKSFNYGKSMYFNKSSLYSYCKYIQWYILFLIYKSDM